MLHNRKHTKLYEKRLKDDKTAYKACPFCDVVHQVSEIRETTRYMRVIVNRTPYDLFEGMRVKEHLMIIPKRHVATVSELSAAEMVDYVRLMGSYEQCDYSVYTRARKSTTRSVEHLHTHLLQMPGRRIRALLFIQKPYVMLHR